MTSRSSKTALTALKKKKPSTKRYEIMLAREKVLKAAQRDGIISNDKACRIGKWSQGWYHLNAMVKAKQLKRAGYNQWMPVGKH